MYFEVQLHVQKIQPKSVPIFDGELVRLKRKEFALVYDLPLNNGLHSVYVESYNQQVKKVTCINSWGMFVDPNPELALRDIDSLYRVNCSTLDVYATQQSKT